MTFVTRHVSRCEMPSHDVILPRRVNYGRLIVRCRVTHAASLRCHWLRRCYWLLLLVNEGGARRRWSIQAAEWRCVDVTPRRYVATHGHCRYGGEAMAVKRARYIIKKAID